VNGSGWALARSIFRKEKAMDVRFHIPTPIEMFRHWKWGLVVLLALAFGLAGDGRASATGHSIETPDFLADVGQWSSMALGVDGKPVVSYYDATNGNLKLLRCGDVNCSSGNLIHAPDTDNAANDTGALGTSLKLDSAGNPVVSYLDQNNIELEVMHCNDPNCIGADESLETPDVGGFQSALALDAIGRPVIAHTGGFGLRLVYCGTVNCDFANSVEGPLGLSGLYFSIALDGLGRPVVTSMNPSGELTVLHCNDANCAGGGESITVPTPGASSEYTSMKLDGSGMPVIAYFDSTNQLLEVMHCNDVNCAGNNESVNAIDPVGVYGTNQNPAISLALDASGNPVIAYYEATNDDLKIAHCGDPNCATFIKYAPDTAGDVGRSASLQLDSAGNPVVSYYDATNGNLKVLHCLDPNCSSDKPPFKIKIKNFGQYLLPKTCFEARNTEQAPLFTVCDNDFQGPPPMSASCLPDAICNDEDPTNGRITVSAAPGDYRLVETVVAPTHVADASKLPCSGIDGGSCEVTFLNSPTIRVWFPWDLNGDRAVSGLDFFLLIGQFGTMKP
jgi:hypothetical protein